MMVDYTASHEHESKRPLWRTPTLSEDKIADVTMFTVGGSGADAGAAEPGYATLGLS